MKKTLALVILFYSHFSNVHACTTFLIAKDGQLLFGRNYDWITDAGMVCTNLKGLSKTSMKTENGETISWVSKFGSITFNQYGKEFPTGGMNEKGLVVELMWLDNTKYPANDKRPAVGVLQWIQYQLDNFSTIEEVIASDNKIRISPTGTTPLHYLIADANGNAATVEFLNGRLVVHKGAELPFPVLTNNTYQESVRAFQNRNDYGNNSLERFNNACKMVQQLPTKTNASLADYAFDILNKVSQGDYTKWSIVYDIKNKRIQFKTYRFQQIKVVNFSAFEFACTSIAKSWDMNQAATGNIEKQFKDFNIEANKMLVETATKESESNVYINPQNREKLWQYPLNTKCQ